MSQSTDQEALKIFSVRVDRRRSSLGAINATGRIKHIDLNVVNNMPKGEGDEVEVVFFKPNLSGRVGNISYDDFKNDFELRGLDPADPISLAAVNEVKCDLADRVRNCTYWKDHEGHLCYMAFLRIDDDREVHVVRAVDNVYWDNRFWLAGIPKKSKKIDK